MSKTRPFKIQPTNPSYTDADYLAAVAQANGFLDYLDARFGMISDLTPQWPMYVWEEVSPYMITPPDPVLQAILDLGTRIGNVNLRLDGLYYALTGPVVE